MNLIQFNSAIITDWKLNQSTQNKSYQITIQDNIVTNPDKVLNWKKNQLKGNLLNNINSF